LPTIQGPLDLVELLRFHHRVGLGDGIHGRGPVVELAPVLVGVAVQGAVQVPAPAVESGKPDPLSAGAAPAWAFGGRLAGTGDISRLCSNKCRLQLDVGNSYRRRVASSNKMFFRGVGAVYDAVERGGCQLGLLLLHRHLLVALGAHVHGSRAAEEAAVIDAEDGTLPGLAAGFLVLHGLVY